MYSCCVTTWNLVIQILAWVQLISTGRKFDMCHQVAQETIREAANITYISPECLYDVWRTSKFSNSTGSDLHTVTSFPVNKWSLELFVSRTFYRRKQDFLRTWIDHRLFVTLFWKILIELQTMCLKGLTVFQDLSGIHILVGILLVNLLRKHHHV